ncbi:hypothetical protein RhiirA5_492489 [Rhizophagus irregularis]|uniref:RanBP2-type domain-containing protein n=4 Tax=Rhizophagus irregularis TaxID=588596 RepID=A0A2I1E018_9GLOM|nr:hypothetical protein GLOIN_2v1783962 [Rhizophagus irregularis DAOM 181602=DAOM 197198]EXX56373.1 hypothetical protein RirG_216780 [Rhizophagus irregularis DAOM 197198w]PKC18023.1 hypothetical protein RhiirA5_492489 [Rhizophagus irregularis]PKY15463.1 hypothetical protein RhiirB3_520424 [Rhizophagus irregularis]POG63522.1 hypothetical protein GLOIN_2v1783962 [Rhizophagus irregularis DAOM 181602=DAOM 197198]UZO10296.1 hypothetical protein OCT59_001887 [Rhizophagus irregularis]|eukprot:XP_025170388.1 hypothetical protein GLOIN_2v1783962 [Rhizophagus irregularis DAOM 181602=DAOM 197198]
MLRPTRSLFQRTMMFVRQITLVTSNNNNTLLFNGTNGMRILPTFIMEHVRRRNIHHGQPFREYPGEWICGECGFKNFSYRTKCFKCDSKPKYRKVAAGDWICSKCEFYNFKSRKLCFKCNTPSPDTDKNEEILEGNFN